MNSYVSLDNNLREGSIYLSGLQGVYHEGYRVLNSRSNRISIPKKYLWKLMAFSTANLRFLHILVSFSAVSLDLHLLGQEGERPF